MDQTFSFDFIGHRKVWYVLSAILILPGLLGLLVWKLNVGIDFRGGTVQDLTYAGTRPTIETVRQDLSKQGTIGLSVQTSGSNDILVRFPDQPKQTPRTTGNAILAALKAKDPLVTEASFNNIGQSVATSSITQAIWAVTLTSLAIICFIAFSFRSVPKPASSWRFGVTAIAALAHDILFVVGAFALIGHFFPNIEVDSLFITAILTILGYSVNDTIVVFDRIRENLRRSPGRSFAEIANSSLNQTLARSINTSAAVLLVLLTLLLLGGDSIRNFVLALFLGVAIGTYSSIFNASPLLVSWQLASDASASRKP
jgi:preprotein translocase subunit SecF